MDDINKQLNAVEAAANNVIKVAAGGDMGAVKAAAGAMIGKCGACHKAYRGPKKK
jgi:cytochrome c556